MKANIGTGDRIVRLLLAALGVGLYFGGVVTGTLGVVLLIVAAVLTLTSSVGFCPLYAAFGLGTRKP